MTVGRRRPPNRPSLVSMTWESARRYLDEFWQWAEKNYAGLGLAHSDTHLPSGVDPITTAAPVAIAISNDEGDDESLSRSDHVHASGLTTKGDLLTVDTALARLAVGTDGQVLTADSTQAKGIKWGTAAAPVNAAFVTIGNDATLTDERALTGSATITVTDGGANSTVTLSVPNDGITDAKLRNSAGFTVIGKATTGTGDPADIGPAGLDTVLLRDGSGNLAFEQVENNQIANTTIQYAKLIDGSAASVLGRAAATAGVHADIGAAGDTVLGRQGAGSLAFTTVATAQIANDAVTYAKIQNAAGFDVIAKATTGAGDYASLAAADETVLGRTGGGNLAFAKVATGQVTDAAITYAKIQDVSAASRLLGRGDSGSGDVQEITIGAGLAITGTELAATGGGGGAPTTAQYVTLATDATLSQERVLTGTANQITVTDGGAGSTVTLSTPQNIHTGAEPTFAGMTFGTEEVNFTSTTPAQITANQNDYNPGNGVFFRINADVSGWDITGLAGGVNGRIVIFKNTGASTIDFIDDSGSSTAANRFSFHANTDQTLGRDDTLFLIYDSTSQRWNGARLTGNHELLSVTHPDTSAATVARGALIIGNSTPAWERVTVGTAGQVLGTDGTDAAWTTVAATQAEQEAATSTTRFATPGRQQFHPCAAKFWVKWTANSTTMLASYNMSSIADTAVGDADGTIATDFSGADWCGQVTTQDTTNSWDNEECQGSGFNATAAGTFGVLCSTITDGGTAACSLTDPDQWHCVGWGDQA